MWPLQGGMEDDCPSLLVKDSAWGSFAVKLTDVSSKYLSPKCCFYSMILQY